MAIQDRGATRDELEYLAGLFDGEGCVVITLSCAPRNRNRRQQHTLKCSLSMTDELTVRMLRGRLGGRLQGPIVRPRRQPQYKWELGGDGAIAALRTLFPSLRVKRRHANLAFLFREGRRRSKTLTNEELRWREALRLRMCELNGHKQNRHNVLVLAEEGSDGEPRSLPDLTDEALLSGSHRSPSLAYLAGLFDAEGHIGVEMMRQKARRQPLHRLWVRVSMTDRVGCEMFYERFGGELREKPERRRGRQPMHRWRIDAHKAAAFLEEIRPFMRVKHRQTDLAVKLQENWVRSNPTTAAEFERRERIRREISGLNGIKCVPCRPVTTNQEHTTALAEKRARFLRFLALDAKGLSAKAIAESLGTWPESINRWRRQPPAYARDLV